MNRRSWNDLKLMESTTPLSMPLVLISVFRIDGRLFETTRQIVKRERAISKMNLKLRLKFKEVENILFVLCYAAHPCPTLVLVLQFSVSAKSRKMSMKNYNVKFIIFPFWQDENYNYPIQEYFDIWADEYYLERI